MLEKISELRRFNGFERAMTQAGPKTVRGAASRTILRVVTLGVGASAQARCFGASFLRGALRGGRAARTGLNRDGASHHGNQKLTLCRHNRRVAPEERRDFKLGQPSRASGGSVSR